MKIIFASLALAILGVSTPANATQTTCMDSNRIVYTMNVESKNITNIVHYWIDGYRYGLNRSPLRKTSAVQFNGTSLIVEAGRQINVEFETYRFVLTPRSSGFYTLKVSHIGSSGVSYYRCN